MDKNEPFINLLRKILKNPKEKIFYQKSENNAPQMLDNRYILDLFISGLPMNLTLSNIFNLNSVESHDKSIIINDIFKANMRRFISIFDSLHDGVLIADKNEIVRYINKSFERISGAKFEDIVGNILSQARPGAKLGGVIRSEKPMLGIRRNFGNIEYMTDMHPIFIDNICVGGITIARDITEIQALQTKLSKYRIRYNNLLRQVQKDQAALYTFKDVISCSSEMKKSKELALKLSHYDMPVLIRGESGTGKELFAHAIHNAGNRSHAPFIVVNCAAIPSTLLESELFGYVEGAFSGAKKGGKKGLIQLADTGTLFLDEIGDMDIELQAKLLRVIQSGEIQAVGSENKTCVDIRILAATNANLEEKMRSGKFRSDLFYRLNVSQIFIPPLRARKEDIVLTAEYFIQKHFVEHPLAPLQLSLHTKEILENYSWPGNVRELESTISFIGSITDNQIISSQFLPPIFHKNTIAAQPCITENTVKISDHSTEEYQYNFKKQRLLNEAHLIEDELKKLGNTVNAKKIIAKKLGISLTTLYARLNILKNI